MIRKNIKVLTLVLAFVMIFGTTTAFAAEGDIFTKANGTLRYSANQINVSVPARNDVRVNNSLYQIEVSGVKYDLAAASAAYAQDPASWKAILSGTQGLTVVNVSAINATQMEVKFSQEVLGTGSANLATNYKVGTTPASTAVLQADKKTVILTFASATTLTGTANAGTNQEIVTVEPIKSVADQTVLSPRYVTTLTYKDTVKPEVVSIDSATNTATATSVTVKFSEPISSLGSVKFDGVSNNTGSLAGDNLSATFTVSLDATVAHNVQFLGLTDTVGNVADLFTESFNITVDTVAATVTAVQSANVDNAFVLTFDKDMNPGTVTGAVINVLDEALSGTLFGTAVVSQPNVNNKKVYLVSPQLGNTIYTSTKTTRVLTFSLPATIKDALGNPIAVTTGNVTLNQDIIKPEITGVEVVKTGANVTSIVVTSSSTLSAGSLVGLSIVDKDGALVTSSTALGALSLNPVTPGVKTITLIPTNTVPLTGKFTFNFAAATLSDQAEVANTSNAISKVVDFGNPTAATGTFTIPNGSYNPATVLQPNPGVNVYTLNFGVAVKGGAIAGSATDLSNYTLNGSALPAGTTITLDFATKQIATITIPNGTIATTDTAAIFRVSGVQDTTGNTVVPLMVPVQINDNIAPVLQSAQKIGDNIILTFNEAMDPTTGADANIGEVLANYEIKSGTDTVVAGSGVATAALVLGDNKKIQISFTTLTGTNFDSTKTITVKTLSGGDLEDANGNAVKANVTVTAQ